MSERPLALGAAGGSVSAIALRLLAEVLTQPRYLCGPLHWAAAGFGCTAACYLAVVDPHSAARGGWSQRRALQACMSTVEELQTALAALRLEVEQLQNQLTLVQERLSTLESRTPPEAEDTASSVSGFEIPAPSESGYRVSAEREDAARQIGRWVQRALDGRLQLPAVRLMDRLDGLEAEDEEEFGVPEATGLLDNLISSGGDVPNFEYSIGVLGIEDSGIKVPVIGVTSIDQHVLVAVPDPAWHRQRGRRLLPEDALVRTVRVEVKCAQPTDRSIPDEQAMIKVWLGYLKATLLDSVIYGGDESLCDVTFPSDPRGLPLLPYGEALLAVAQDHYAFVSAESQAPQPQPDFERRLASVEENMSAMLQEIRNFTAPKAVPLPPRRTASVGRAPTAPPGLDPHIAHQALAAGVSPAALQEIGGLVQPARQVEAPLPVVRGISSDDDEEDPHLGSGGGSADPMQQAVLGLSNLVTEMRKERKEKAGRGLEGILDRVEHGSAKDGLGSSRTKSAALRSLQKLLTTNPKLLYTAIEGNMQDDWEMGGQRMPGASITRISARGWLEHRSRIGGFPGTIRPAWLLCGIWDCLMSGRHEEARARTALAVACYDQMACDKGSWLIPNEMTLEPAPPYAAFSRHCPPDAWEAQHTRLVDERWIDLMMSKLRDLAEYQEKRGKLTSGKARNDDAAAAASTTTAPKNENKESKKGKGKGGKKGKGSEEEPKPPAAAA
eukprot:Skav226914  [mRNA]  locus=scaffold1147:32653:34984:+ [translate_table: standard]